MKEKKTRDTTTLVTTSSEIMKRLEQLGTSELFRLKIDDVYALLVITDAQGPISKPNKKTWQENANLLPTVHATLRHSFAVATVESPLPISLAFPLVISEGENKLNLLIEGLPEKVNLCLTY